MLSVPAVLGPMFFFMLAAGFGSPLAVAGALSADPRLIGSASGLFGFIQMGFGALCTTLAGLWPVHSATPVAAILLAAALLGLAAFLRVPPP
jgi:DHA1 family bicyclomycin/chloramphenicol resistance-like MFS transporter